MAKNVGEKRADTKMKEEDEVKKLPLIMRPFARVARRSPAIVRGMSIALAVYWLQQFLMYMGWMSR